MFVQNLTGQQLGSYHDRFINLVENTWKHSTKNYLKIKAFKQGSQSSAINRSWNHNFFTFSKSPLVDAVLQKAEKGRLKTILINIDIWLRGFVMRIGREMWTNADSQQVMCCLWEMVLYRGIVKDNLQLQYLPRRWSTWQRAMD